MSTLQKGFRAHFITGARALAAAAALTLLAPAQGLAEGPASPPPSVRTFERTGNPCSQKDGMGQEALQQVGTYCAAADAAEDAAGKQKMLGGIHAAVAAFCLVPCTSQWTGAGLTLSPYCTGASIAAGVTDIVMTQQFTGAVGVAMGAYGLYQTWGSNAAIKAGQQAATSAGTKLMDKAAVATASEGGEQMAQTVASGQNAAKGSAKMACFTAAVETVQSVMSFMGAGSSEKTAKENRAAAGQLVGQSLILAPGVAGSGAPAIAAAAVASAPGSGPGTAGSVRDGSSATGSNGLKPLLSSGSCSGGFSSQVSCLAAKGVALPPTVTNPEFIPTLEKMAKMPIDQLMSGGSTGSILGNAVAGAFGQEARANIQATVAKVEEEVRAATSSSGATYASGGGGGGDGAGAEPDPLAQLGNLLGGLNQKPGEEPQNFNTTQVFRKPAEAYGAGIEQDPRVSLFDRVSRRYLATRDRVATLRYASPENRALAR